MKNFVYEVVVERVETDKTKLRIEAPTFDVAESRALSQADADRGVVWGPAEVGHKVLNIRRIIQ